MSSAGVSWQGWEDRVRADPSFKDKVLIEQVNSGTRTMPAMQQAPPCSLSSEWCEDYWRSSFSGRRHGVTTKLGSV